MKWKEKQAANRAYPVPIVFHGWRVSGDPKKKTSGGELDAATPAWTNRLCLCVCVCLRKGEKKWNNKFLVWHLLVPLFLTHTQRNKGGDR